MGWGFIAPTIMIGCASSAALPPASPETAPSAEDSTLPSAQQERRATSVRPSDITIDGFIGCTPVEATPDVEVCVREQRACEGLSSCRTVPSAFCFRHNGDELCFSDPAPCFSSVDVAEKSGETASSCYVLSSRAWAAASVGTTAPYTATASAVRPSLISERLLLFGGDDHKTFLGCLCSEYEIDSVFNAYGSYGNPYNLETIWSAYGDFGSAYSNRSACNAYATEPPVIVTKSGRFVGYLTVNEYKPGAITDPDVLLWLKQKVCAH